MTASKNQGEFLTLSDLLELIKGNRQWFLVSLAVTLSLAVIYIAVTPPVFTRTASVKINNDSKDNASSSSEMEALSDMGLFKSNTDVKSEIYTFQSPLLMEEVVQRLKLDCNYAIKFKSVRKVDLYHASPVTVVPDSTLSDAAIDFMITLLSSGKVQLSQITVDGIDYPDEPLGKLSKPLAIHGGSVTIYPTGSYKTTGSQDPVYFSKQLVKSVVKGCCASLSASLSEDEAPIIQLSYSDVNAQRAEDVLNTLILVYNKNWIKDKNQIATGTSQFINERLKVIEKELGTVDESIATYKSANLMPDVSAVSSLYLSRSSENTTQLVALENQQSMAHYLQAYIKGNGSENQLLPANTGIENANIEGQIDNYNTLLLQKNGLAANSSEKNPLVTDMSRSLKSVKQLITLSLNEYISTLNIRIDNLRRNEKSTNLKIASSPAQAKHLLSEERQQKVKEALYLFLLQKREENELSQAFTAYNTKVINRPDGSNSPTSPRRKVIFLLALVIGLIAPAIILILIENLNTLVRGRKDLESMTIPFAGEIPLVVAGKKKHLQLLKRFRFFNGQSESYQTSIVVEDKNRNIVNEAFRNVRTNLDFMRPKSEQGTVILSTSFNPGSGKTFISGNLAVSMAVKGARTVVIDADMRKGSLSTLVGSPQTGLSNYLNASIDILEDILVKGVLHPCLDVIPAGIIPPNPSELLLSERFSALVATLRSHYDYIFIDCPPYGIVSDTSIIARFTDLNLFVIRAGILDKRNLPEVDQLYTSGQLKNMAVVLNGVDYESQGRYGYRYGYHKYGYKYGYHKYGYGENTSNGV